MQSEAQGTVVPVATEAGGLVWPPPFETFKKIPRLGRTVIITEKLDGTNAQVFVPHDPRLPLAIGSRNRWITPGKTTDNYDFARWVMDNEEAIRRLGPGRHFGEWWGVGIARRYGIAERRWSLFNTSQWTEQELRDRDLPSNVHVVPLMAQHELRPECGFDPVQEAIGRLKTEGSLAAPGFMDPEGIVIRHSASAQLYKWTFDGDGREQSKPKRRGPMDLPPGVPALPTDAAATSDAG
jgi:hypothetical protein